MANCRKTSTTLARRQVRNLSDAHRYAATIGRPLNITCTIHASLVGGPGHGPWQYRRFPRLWHYLRRQFQKWGLRWTAIYVHESDETGKELHTHIFIHAPHRSWLKRIDAYVRKHIVVGATSPAVKTTWVWDNNGHPDKWMNYMIKHRSGHVGRSAPVTGKRCGVSRNIDRAARARHRRMSRRVMVGLP